MLIGGIDLKLTHTHTHQAKHIKSTPFKTKPTNTPKRIANSEPQETHQTNHKQTVSKHQALLPHCHLPSRTSFEKTQEGIKTSPNVELSSRKIQENTRQHDRPCLFFKTENRSNFLRTKLQTPHLHKNQNRPFKSLARHGGHQKKMTKAAKISKIITLKKKNFQKAKPGTPLSAPQLLSHVPVRLASRPLAPRPNHIVALVPRTPGHGGPRDRGFKKRKEPY